ncbi:MAG: OmpA family protein [Treponema sp.]|jgi:flagellar hook assembly protein FlgD|nr:OmpA family protein [Treponema sp.]
MKKRTVFASIVFLSLAALGGIAPLFAQSEGQGEAASPAAKAPKPKYISPNNDGVQDTLVIPLKINEKERYLSEWKLVIKNAGDVVVRTIENKETRPPTNNFKTFWKILFTPQKGVAVPDSVMWDGTLDTGEIAPDGVYSYSVSAADDNGNTATSREYTVVVDNTPPEVKVTQPSSSDKFFGEGAKATLRIPQSGSEEELWKARITDTAGKPVWTREWKGASPTDVHWDGRDDSGALVADGVYNYEISARDLAGNSSPEAKVTNIIYSGVKPVTSLAVSGSRYFSPGTASVFKELVFLLTVPQPSSGNTLENWSLEVLDANGVVQRSFEGTSSAPAQQVFDGKGAQGSYMPDGVYYAQLKAAYKNGYVTPYVRTGDFTLDRKAPTAQVTLASDKLFAPGGAKGTVTLNQKLSTEPTSWKGEVLNSAGAVVRSVDLGSTPAPSFVWNGLDNNGKICADGTYSYRVSNTDLAGNATSVSSDASFTLDTSKTEVMLTVQPAVFSPNGDKIQDTLTITPVVKAAGGVGSYSLTIQDAQGKVVRKIEATGSLPSTISWDGKTDAGTAAPDGQYKVTLKTVANSGTASEPVTSEPFVIDTVPPKVALTVSEAAKLFSPDGLSRKQKLPLSLSTSPEDHWTASITGRDGKAVRSYDWYNGPASLSEWDGRDNSGNLAPDGEYRLTISATDAGGNSASAAVDKITIDTRPATAWVTNEFDAISANPAARTRLQDFRLNVSLKDGVESWRFSVSPVTVGIDGAAASAGSPVKTWEGGAIPANLTWDGKTASGTPAEGNFTGVLEISYLKGNDVRAETSPFVSTALPPQLSVGLGAIADLGSKKVRPVPPGYFSPDNDGENDELYIDLRAQSLLPFSKWEFSITDPAGNAFWGTSGKTAITPRIVWNGQSNKTRKPELVQSAMDYDYQFTVTDSQGLESSLEGKIPIDILVIKRGNELYMQVPAITFRANKADFGTTGQGAITQAQADNNERVLKRITEVLGKFRDYRVTVVGHENNVSGTAKEAEDDALSKERAEFVKSWLSGHGVSDSRLSTRGMGAREPIASHSDRPNWWKNRRVEFILNK